MRLINRAAQAMPWSRRRRGFTFLDEATLRRNLSFVLHEHSQSAAVTEVAHACEQHARQITGLDLASLPMVPEPSLILSDIDVWLTATLGLPAATVETLASTGATVIFVDSPTATGAVEHAFFRALARLSLPADAPLRAAVGAVILRPGGTSTILDSAGPFTWRDDYPAAIRALEHLIQRYADQWMPHTTLWPAPAETLLGPDEIWLAE